MTVYEPVRALILGDAAIVALVAARVWPLRLPQKPTLPAIVVTRVSDIRATPLRGSASVARPRVQVDCWAQSSDQAAALGALVRQRLENYDGQYTDAASPATTVEIQTRYADGSDRFDEDINGGTCRHLAEYLVFHSTNGGSV